MSFELCEFLFSKKILRGPKNLFELGEFSNYRSSNYMSSTVFRFILAAFPKLLVSYIITHFGGSVDIDFYLVELQETEKPILAIIDTMQFNVPSAPFELTSLFPSQGMA